MSRFGYARVSTNGQSLDQQLRELKAAGCSKIFCEKISGAGTNRIQLTHLLKVLQRGDVVLVTRLDRLARSTRDLLNFWLQWRRKAPDFDLLPITGPIPLQPTVA